MLLQGPGIGKFVIVCSAIWSHILMSFAASDHWILLAEGTTS